MRYFLALIICNLKQDISQKQMTKTLKIPKKIYMKTKVWLCEDWEIIEKVMGCICQKEDLALWEIKPRQSPVREVYDSIKKFSLHMAG